MTTTIKITPELAESAEYLRRFQDWRSGDDARCLSDADIHSDQVTVHLCRILEAFGLGEPVVVCHKCQHHGGAWGCARGVDNCIYQKDKEK